MKQIYNFSAGPAVLPKEVLIQAKDELLNYANSGMSVMEMSHRSKVYETILQEAKQDLRDIANIPDNYEILFIQGGASLQFSMVPMNLIKNGKADYFVTGQFAKKAYEEAKLFLDAKVVASSKEQNFTTIPDVANVEIREDADYVYICENNTIYGTKFKELPNTKDIPLVADVSSCFLSEPIDITKYGLLFAGAQKNIGPSGVCVVIIRKDLIREETFNPTPTMLKYKTYADHDSMYNTPPTYTIYMCGKVFKWIKEQGGLVALQKRNSDKAKLLYDAIEQSNLFKCPVDPNYRSIMNVPFVTGNEELDAKFIKEAKEAGLENIKGHRSVGGMRASIYNAMPLDGIQTLVAFMHDFEEREGKIHV
ncbi:3-phosphoserine/phosphohydroxythreonine transaminase [Anaerorhabdus furcosa]|uniref:Phosphoserine aminotransferase n=1 Tax=Anaerorhabdus furcosa TaxID=118967 RepID=A0A1T4NX92_9FIRM|nr:3-phosphoserine/phosphohydroxythreonine transaminase [Anaerorhabdus furcosa]SJZ83666.1 phosphoserine aminotransferase apoenzyme [Anaerorhabdus furcosa]